MDNTPNETEEKANKEMQTMRVMWTIFIVAFAVLVLFDLYQWSNGRENLRRIFPPLGMIFAGLGAIILPRNRALTYVFTGVALVLLITGLILMIIY